ncbi:MAG: DUF2806 domain-containing protein [Labilithrix sp.]|nr:DUF2806 domain-containing protein [Labilithrix sp.]MCW5816429.1 DUF2806 domain-containing protein [Labilithrix sp.]
MPDPITLGAVALTALGGGVAAKKLLEVAQSGVGAVARPWLTVRDAQAKAKADKILEAGAIEVRQMREAAEAPPPRPSASHAAPTVPNLPAPELAPPPRTLPAAPDLALPRADEALAVEVVFDDLPALPARAEARLMYQEAKRQHNVESVIHEAAEELKDVPDAEISEERVDDDWTARFFNDVQDVSNGQMRKIWAKVLAGEVKRPRSFHIRTLETLKKLSQAEAESFSEILSYTCGPASQQALIIRDEGDSVSFEQGLALADAGLLSPSPVSFRVSAYDASPADEFRRVLAFHDKAIRITGPREDAAVRLDAWALTRAGCELSSLIPRGTPSIDFLQAVARHVSNYGFDVEVFELKTPVRPAASDSDDSEDRYDLGASVYQLKRPNPQGPFHPK